MVGPSLTPAEYASGMNRLRAAFVALVGLSGGLVALSAGAGPLVAVAVTLAGLLVGVALVWYLGQILPEPR